MDAAARPSDAELRELARRVLEREEFAQYRTIVTDAQLELLRWLQELLDRIRLLHADSPPLYWALVLGLSVVSLALIAHVVWTIRVAIRASAERAGPDVHAHTAPDYRAQAAALARDGHFLDAARLLQLASVQRLVERGHLALRRHEPNRVLRARIADALTLPAALRGDLRARIGELERSWFRERAERAELYEDWQRVPAQIDRLDRLGQLDGLGAAGARDASAGTAAARGAR